MKRKAFAWKLAGTCLILLLCVSQIGAEEPERRDRPVPTSKTPAGREAPEPGRRAPRPERARRDAPPRPIVIQLNNLSVESFAATLKQLARNPHVAAVLRELPLAINEEANAIVAIAPPEAGEFLTAIARGLDRPSRYHEASRERERQERQFRMRREMMERAGAAPIPRTGPPARPGPGAGAPAGPPRPPHVPPGPARAPRPEPGAEKAPVRPGPLGMRLHSLLAPRAVEKLGLRDQQVEKIRSILKETAEHGANLLRRVAEERERIGKESRGRIFECLEPEQREAAERLLEAPRPGAQRKPAPAARPEHPERREGGRE